MLEDETALLLRRSDTLRRQTENTAIWTTLSGDIDASALSVELFGQFDSAWSSSAASQTFAMLDSVSHKWGTEPCLNGNYVARNGLPARQCGPSRLQSPRRRASTIRWVSPRTEDPRWASFCGQNVADFHRQAAGYVDRILKGAKPEDLPVEQPTKFDLVINRKPAEALGSAIPLELLVSADRVIE
jgi:ABC transporter substrate binding protein